MNGEEEPYIIEGHEIDGAGYVYGIYVGNTTVYFVVCVYHVHNASGMYDYPYFVNVGIDSYRVQNGRFENNYLSYNIEGFVLNKGDTNIIDNNKILVIERVHGIKIWTSNHNIISNNLIVHKDDRSGPVVGIDLFTFENDITENNTIVNNYISGITFGTLFVNCYSSNIHNYNTFSSNERNIDTAILTPSNKVNRDEKGDDNVEEKDFENKDWLLGFYQLLRPGSSDINNNSNRYYHIGDVEK